VAQHVGQGLVSMIHFDAHADTGHIKFGWLEVLSGTGRRRRDARDGTTWDSRQPLIDDR
jgi:hypothetical protein